MAKMHGRQPLSGQIKPRAIDWKAEQFVERTLVYVIGGHSHGNCAKHQMVLKGMIGTEDSIECDV